MAITLQTIKQFISDNANSMADTAASRTLDRIVQDTLLGLGREYDWSFLRTRERIVTRAADVYTGVVNATQGSGDFVLSSGTWPSTYPAENRELVVGSAINSPYTAASIEQTTVADDTFRANSGQEWLQATATGLTATAYRPRYQTTNKIKKLIAARILGPTRIDLDVLNRGDYEMIARLFTTSASQVREVVAVSPLEVAFFPMPDQRYDVELEIIRKIVVPAEGALDATELDWPDEMVDLLRAACRMQIIERLGDEAVPFDAPLAMKRYESLLKGYKREQGTRNVDSFEMKPGGPSLSNELTHLRGRAT